MPVIIDGTTGIALSANAGINQSGSGLVTLQNALKPDSGGTGLASPGTSGNVLTSNGTSWVSQTIPLAIINLESQVTNTLKVANGGTGLTSAGNFGNQLISNGTAFVSAPARVNTIVISTNTNALAGNYYVATAILTLTLPGSPSVGDIVGFSNPTINITSIIDRNGANILGLAENLTFDKGNASVVFQYSGVNKGWVFA